MNTHDYLDRLMAHFEVNTVYALAQRLGLRETTVRTWKKGGTIGQDHAHLIGDILGIDPAIIMADMAAESAPNDRIRSTWARLAEQLRAHSPAIAAALLGVSLTAANAFDTSSMYIMLSTPIAPAAALLAASLLVFRRSICQDFRA